MNVFQPLVTTDTNLTASNVAETDNAEWLVGTAYTLGNTVMIATTAPNIHRNYELLAANSTGDQPWTDDGSIWLDLGATNRWKMFDQGNSTQTTNADDVDVTITPGLLTNAIALLNISGLTAQIIVTDPSEGIVYDTTRNLISDSGIGDWYAYYFTPIERITDIVAVDLPSYPAATIQVIVEETGETVAVGVLAMGAQVAVGITDHGTGIGIRDYSVKETDTFGNFTILQRSFSKRADYAITVETSRVAFVQNYLTSIRSQPVVWIGNENFGSTLIYGYYRDFDIVLSSPQISQCSITVEGLT